MHSQVCHQLTHRLGTSSSVAGGSYVCALQEVIAHSKFSNFAYAYKFENPIHHIIIATYIRYYIATLNTYIDTMKGLV